MATCTSDSHTHRRPSTSATNGTSKGQDGHGQEALTATDMRAGTSESSMACRLAGSEQHAGEEADGGLLCLSRRTTVEKEIT